MAGETYNSEKIERYAGCSLRYLFDDLMELKLEGFIDYHPDRIERGLLMRHILKEFSAKMETECNVPQKAEAALKKIAENAFEIVLTEKDDFFSTKFKNGLLAGLSGAAANARRRPGVLRLF